MITKTIATLLLVLFIAGPAMAGTFTLALLDCSGSMLNEGVAKDSPLTRNLEELKEEIGRLGKDDVLLVYGFGRKSEAQFLKVTMPHVAGPKGMNLAATREAAVKKLAENVRDNAGVIDKSRTDLIGALKRAARVFSESGTQAKRLILYSDAIDTETLGLSLKKLRAGRHKQYLKKLDTMKVPYPDLKNVTVDIYAVLAGEKELNGIQTEIAIAELKELWAEYFKRSGTSVSSYRTSTY